MPAEVVLGVRRPIQGAHAPTARWTPEPGTAAAKVREGPIDLDSAPNGPASLAFVNQVEVVVLQEHEN